MSKSQRKQPEEGVKVNKRLENRKERRLDKQFIQKLRKDSK